MRYCVQTLSRYDPPPDSVPLRADIRTFDWERLAKAQRELTGRLFDVIMMDPPWQLATANPTRGVAIAYEQLGDDVIRLMPLDLIQTDGYLFLWVINILLHADETLHREFLVLTHVRASAVGHWRIRKHLSIAHVEHTRRIPHDNILLVD